MRTTDIEKTLVCGADPGCSGCIVILDQDGHFVEEIRMDGTYTEICSSFNYYAPRVAFGLIENVHSMPKQGVASSFKFGASFGFLKGMFYSHKIKHDYITPQQWQKSMGCMSKGDKNVTKDKAQRLFPDLKVIHRNADALLIAEMGRQIMKQKGY